MSLDDANLEFINTRINELHTSYNTVSVGVAKLEAALQDHTEHYRTLDSRVIEVSKAMVAFEECVKTVRERLSKVDNWKDEYSDLLDDIQRVLQGVSSANAAVKSQQERNMSSLSRLDQAREDLVLTLKGHQHEINAYDERLEELETLTKSHAKDIENINGHIRFVKRFGVCVSALVGGAASLQGFGLFDWFKAWFTRGN